MINNQSKTIAASKRNLLIGTALSGGLFLAMMMGAHAAILPSLQGNTTSTDITLFNCNGVLTTDANSKVSCTPFNRFNTQSVAPYAPIVTAVQSGANGSQITLTITPTGFNRSTITGYTTALGTVAGGEVAPITISSFNGNVTTGITYDITGLAASTTFFGKVFAVNASGVSNPSSEWTAATAALAPASAYTVVQNTATEAVGTAITYTVTPSGGTWPTTTLTATSTLAGAFAVSSITPSGTTPVVFTFTPSAASTGTVTISGSGMTNSTGALSNTVTTAQVSTTYTFAGTQGYAPSGTYLLTNFFSFSNSNTITTDGTGALNLGNSSTSASSFNALPIKGDGTYTYTYKASTTSREMFALLRVSAGGDGYYVGYTDNAYTIGKRIAGVNTNILVGFSGSIPVNTIFITLSGTTITIGHDSTTITSVTDSSITANGYFGLGSANPANGTAISSVSTP